MSILNKNWDDLNVKQTIGASAAVSAASVFGTFATFVALGYAFKAADVMKPKYDAWKDKKNQK